MLNFVIIIDIFSRLNQPFLKVENTVEKSLTALRRRHLECYNAILKVRSEKICWNEQINKHLFSLKSSLSDQANSKDLLVYLAQLSQLNVVAESILFTVRSKLGNLQVKLKLILHITLLFFNGTWYNFLFKDIK